MFQIRRHLKDVWLGSINMFFKHLYHLNPFVVNGNNMTILDRLMFKISTHYMNEDM